jgi:hypothetical protein
LSADARDPLQTLWTSGTLRCVFIPMKPPAPSAVHVFDGDSPVCLEDCKDAADAAIVAKRLWTIFADPEQ